MRKRFLGFTFDRESYWIVLLLLVPLLGILVWIVIPGLWQRWFVTPNCRFSGISFSSAALVEHWLPSRRGPVAAVGFPWPCPPFPAACPCRVTIAAPASPLTDPNVPDCGIRFLTQDSPCWSRYDRCAA